MAKRARAYKGEKRRKELKRQKKQEEKRLRRLGKSAPEAEDPAGQPDDAAQGAQADDRQAEEESPQEAGGPAE